MVSEECGWLSSQGVQRKARAHRAGTIQPGQGEGKAGETSWRTSEVSLEGELEVSQAWRVDAGLNRGKHMNKRRQTWTKEPGVSRELSGVPNN